MLVIVEKNEEPQPAVLCRNIRHYKRRIARGAKTYTWDYYKLDCSIPKPIASKARTFIIIPLSDDELSKLEREELVIRITSLKRLFPKTRESDSPVL